MKNNKSQFELEKDYYLNQLDFLNWYRFFSIIKEAINIKPESVLEIGEGSGIVKNILKPIVKSYKTMDVNKNLRPDYLNDVRKLNPKLKKKFNLVIIADVLEHLPFLDLEKSLFNLLDYLKKGGYAIITIPHRSHYILSMTSLKHKPLIIRMPTLKRLIKGRAWIDPDHQWEIGDGKHKIKDVEKTIKKSGFKIEKREKLLYVDFWVLKRQN